MSDRDTGETNANLLDDMIMFRKHLDKVNAPKELSERADNLLAQWRHFKDGKYLKEYLELLDDSRAHLEKGQVKSTSNVKGKGRSLAGQNKTLNGKRNTLNGKVKTLNGKGKTLKVSFANQTIKYPTDPLTETEINKINQVIRADSELAPLFTPSDTRNTPVFLEAFLKEPNKDYVSSFDEGSSLLDRRARVLLYENHTNKTREIILALPEDPIDDPIIESKTVIAKAMYPNNNNDNYPISDEFAGSQPYEYFTSEELTELVKTDTFLVNRLAAYGVTFDMLESGKIRPYAFYTFEAFRQTSGIGSNLDDVIPVNAPNHRYVPAGFFDVDIANTATPAQSPANWGFVDGIFIMVDCTAKSIFRIVEDTSKIPAPGQPPIPESIFDPYPYSKHDDLKPIYTSMPEGPSFTIPVDDIHKVSWASWEFRWGYGRHGLSLYNIFYTERLKESETKRKVIYKLSASDSVVVYNATEPLIQRNYVSADSHNWPILPRLQPLVLGRDVPGYANLYPVTCIGASGEGVTIPDSVAFYEKDDGLLWRVNQGVIDFINWPNGFTEEGDLNGAPSTGSSNRKLYVTSIFSGFYYLFAYTYTFSLDGTIECYYELMGQTTNQWIAYEEPATGTDPDPSVENGEVRGVRIAKQLLALNHTHAVVWRADFELDTNNNPGGNTVEETNASVVNSRNVNPAGQVMEYNTNEITREDLSGRDQIIGQNRTWGVHNRQSKNRLGHERGYHIFSTGFNGNSDSLLRDNSQALLHYGFLKHHLYVTRYNEAEQYACGEFPVLSRELTGIEKYIENRGSTEDTDVVVWFNRMFAHNPSTEDYPFISAKRMGMTLSPNNFFDMNPACSFEQHIEIDLDGKGAKTKPIYKPLD